jgi:hypothetical protein
VDCSTPISRFFPAFVMPLAALKIRRILRRDCHLTQN